MRVEKWTALLNAVLDSCKFIPVSDATPRMWTDVFPNRSKRAHFFADDMLIIDARAFDRAMSELLATEVGKTISREKAEETLVPKLRKKCLHGSVFDDEDAAAIRVGFESQPNRTYTVAREIFGVSLPSTSAPLSVGMCCIYDWERHKEQIGGPDAVEKPWDWGGPKHGLMAECKVCARDELRAKELSDAAFYSLENILYFLAGTAGGSFNIGVVSLGAEAVRTYYMFSDEAISGSHGVEAGSNFDLGRLIRADLEAPYPRLLRMLSSPVTTFEKKILRAVEWLGQAIRDPNPASGFVKAAIPLEVLLSFNEKGVITPSIMSQISENCAHILGESPEECLVIEQQVKRFYGTRSAIVHGGSDNVSLEDVRGMFDIAKSALLAVLLLENISSPESLKIYLQRKKYSSSTRRIPDA